MPRAACHRYRTCAARATGGILNRLNTRLGARHGADGATCSDGYFIPRRFATPLRLWPQGFCHRPPPTTTHAYTPPHTHSTHPFTTLPVSSPLYLFHFTPINCYRLHTLSLLGSSLILYYCESPFSRRVRARHHTPYLPQVLRLSTTPFPTCRFGQSVYRTRAALTPLRCTRLLCASGLHLPSTAVMMLVTSTRTTDSWEDGVDAVLSQRRR